MRCGHKNIPTFFSLIETSVVSRPKYPMRITGLLYWADDTSAHNAVR